jgi:hypothetical protein
MSAWSWLFGALGFALWAAVPVVHPRARTKTIVASVEAEHVPSSGSPALPDAAPAEARPPETTVAPAARRLPLRRSKSGARTFDAGDGRAILETGLRPAVLERPSVR